jgi:predicted kinase
MKTIFDYMPALPGDPVDWVGIERSYTWPAEMLATPQDKRHHTEGDVWTHTKMVVESLLSLPEYWELSSTGRRVTFGATLLHDIAKPATTVHQDDGSITSNGHSRRGAIDTRILLWREGTPFSEREMIARIVGIHQEPFHVMNREDYTFRLRKLSHEVRMDWLGLMARSDALGRYTTPAQARQETLDNVALYQIACEEDGILSKPYPSADPATWMRYLDVRGENCDPRYPVPNMATGSRVYMLSGLPGMGKDDWISKYARGLPVLSYDQMRETMGQAHGDNPGAMVQAVKDEAKVLLRENKSFVWNATHLSPALREKALGLLRSYGAYVTMVYIEVSDEKRWRSQNRNREHSLPDAALDPLLFKWEPPAENEAHSIEYWIDGVRHTVIEPCAEDACVISIAT